MAKRESTLCWRCARPGSESCCWDRELRPVPGWRALPRPWRGPDGERLTSFHVLACPGFREENGKI